MESWSAAGLSAAQYSQSMFVYVRHIWLEMCVGMRGKPQGVAKGILSEHMG